MRDILITGGTVYDGTGAPPVAADVLVSGEKIADLLPREAGMAVPPDCQRIDAAGHVVAPGFVDVHSHSDLNCLLSPGCESKLFQGITTEIVGNCGMSAFPVLSTMDDEISGPYAQAGRKACWSSASGYFDTVDAAAPALNYASFVGHSNVRAEVMGFSDRAPDSAELSRMTSLVEQALEEGALGLSTGLIYMPGMYAKTAEIIALQKAAARKGGIYSSHVRGEGDRLKAAATEFLRVIREVGCQGQYSHLKASGRRNWGLVPWIIEEIEKINSSGGFVRFDKYPYVASGTELSSLLPRWAHEGGREEAANRLREPRPRERLIRELREDYAGYSPWSGVLLTDPGSAEFSRFSGQTIEQIARELAIDPYELYVELLVASSFRATICNFTMSQDETDLAILHPCGMVCSDAEIRTTTGPLAGGSPHPRAFGAFPKFFRDYVFDTKRLSLEAAIAKATSIPCDTFGFVGRGRVARGCFADLVIFDAARLRDRSTFSEPLNYSEGVQAVVVNGTVTMLDGVPTGERGGRVLRRQ